MNRNLDFTKLDYDAITFPTASFDQWKAKAEKTSGKSLDQLVSSTMENIDAKSLYTKEDIAGFPHLGYVAGIPPYFRGPYPSMYVTKPWTVRQYAGFSTAEESNAFYRRNLAAGQMGLSIAFDLATNILALRAIAARGVGLGKRIGFPGSGSV